MSQAAAMPMPSGSTMPGIGVYNLKFGMWVFLLSEVMFFMVASASRRSMDARTAA